MHVTSVDTMLKDSHISSQTVRRTHRTYSAQFKIDLVAACLRPGASFAALALQHGMNANVLHRWLQEYDQGRHRPNGRAEVAVVAHSDLASAFIPIPLSTSALAAQPTPTSSAAAAADIRIELQRNGLCVTLEWPLSAASACAQMLREVLR